MRLENPARTDIIFATLMDTGKKVIIGIVIATVILLIGGVFLVAGGNKPVATSDLVPADAAKIGKADAKLVLVEFGDFECPACAGYVPIVHQMLSKYENGMEYVWRNFPLPQHKNALTASYAVEAAARQGKFETMFDKLYATQNDWAQSDNAAEIFTGYAKGLGLDTQQFANDMDSAEIHQLVQRDVDQANALGINATPTFYLNGVQMTTASGPAQFEAAVDTEAEKVGVSPVNAADSRAQAELKVILSGNELDMSQAKYQSSGSAKLSPDIFLEGGNGKALQIQKKGATLGEFFDSLGMKFSDSCLELDTGEKYCNSGQKSLKMYVNGQVSGAYQNLQPADGDKVLVTYGDETVSQVQTQIDSMDR